MLPKDREEGREAPWRRRGVRGTRRSDKRCLVVMEEKSWQGNTAGKIEGDGAVPVLQAGLFINWGLRSGHSLDRPGSCTSLRRG